ncbi:MAG: GNAT family N-acetyltransferase [Polynucleobacter sp.]
MSTSITITDWEDARELVKPIRIKVFILEQKVPEELEWDEYDETAWHAVAKSNHQVIGTGRLIINQSTAKIGRMAIDPEYRGKGIGIEMLKALINKGKEKGAQEFILHAQTHAIAFYAREGFEPYGPIFDEAGIPHVEMRLYV